METQESRRSETDENTYICAFCEEVLKKDPYNKNIKGKRKAVAITDTNGEMRKAMRQHER